MVVEMRTKMSRGERKRANFLLRSIKDYGIPNFDVNSANVREFAYNEDVYGVVSYLVTVGANVVSIEYYCSDCKDCLAYVRVNDYTVTHCEVTCFFDMAGVVKAFAALVSHLN